MLAFGAGCGPAASEPGRRPSLVLIVIDTLRADRAGLGRGAGADTPFLDELADRAVVFERAYAAASWTRASTATLFTGRLPESHGCENLDGTLGAELTTLAEVLSERGYQTRALVTNPSVVDGFGFGQGFDVFTWAHDPEQPYLDAHAMGDAALELVEDLDPRRPFFLYLHYMDPHAPYRRHAETDPAVSPPTAFTSGTIERLRRYRTERGALGPVHDERVRQLYDGEITFCDLWLREVWKGLERRGLLADTWLALTSDHGEGLWDHGRRGHGWDVFEEQVRVPLLLRPPHGLPFGRRVAAPFSHVDLAPTLVDLLALPAVGAFDGVSWAGVIARGEEPPRRDVLVDQELDVIALGVTRAQGVRLRAIVDGSRKLIVDDTDGREWLVDLEADPGERAPRPVGADVPGELRTTASRLRARLEAGFDAARARRPAPPVVGDGEPVRDEVLAQLRALGYLGDDH